MQTFAIIVAGGSGIRMGIETPKQFLTINGLPILMHTIKAFTAFSDELSVIVVLPARQFDFWDSLCQQYSFHERHLLVAGGETRFDSVRNGLASINDTSGLVAVHDGVRPVIDKKTIANGFRHAAEFGSAVTCISLKDSIRRVNADGKNIAENRASFRLIQTPQTFRLDWIQNAFNTAYQSDFTDCASVLEAAGYPIQLIEGSYENIKITTPEDLRWAEIYL